MFSKKSLYTLNWEGIESFKRVSILKLGPLKGTPTSTSVGCPRSTLNSKGSIISSTIQNVAPFDISGGRGSYYLIKAACSVFSYATFIPNRFTLLPKLSVKSLLKRDYSISLIKLKTASLNGISPNPFIFNSVLDGEIS